MAVINASGKFRSYHSKSIPIVPVPKNVRQALNIERMYKNGIAKIEPSKTNSLYDRCYVFDEINYINKDESEKDVFLNQFMSWLKSMSVDFKITIANEFQSIDEFLEKIRGKQNSKAYPQIDKGIKEWTREKLENSNPNVTTLRYLTVSCRANSLEEATILLNALDTTIQQMFAKWRGKILLLNGEERLKCLHALLRPGKKDEEQYIYLDETGKHDWKNDVMPQTIKQYSNFMIFDKTQYVSVLFGWKYSRALKPDELMRSFSYVDFPSFITLDFSPVPADVINEKLVAAAMNNEKSISEEEEAKRKKNIIVSGPSYAKQRKKDEIEGYMDLVNDNDETGFFLNFLFVATAADETTLAQRVEQLKETGKAQRVVISTADYTQLKALNTALPFAGRQVDYMRFFLSSSMVAMQPYFAQDILDPGGYFYGLNLTTKRLIFGNRKLLMNPHAIIVGHTGSGKSVLIKATEIFQTLISTSDDILILDPQNEFKEIVEKYGGSYFDLTPKSKIYINGFEVSDEVFYADKDTKEKFIATQTKYAKSLVAAIMTNILFTQEHATVVSRATRKMFDKIFAQKRLKKQATLRMLREEIRLELENAKDDYDRSIIKPIFNSLEEYTEGSCDMLAYPSTVCLNNRMIGFGLKNVPPDNWEPVMVTVMHYTSTRMEYNQEAQRATHFIVDETQVVSRKGTSAEQLNTAVATFRKYGGICTMAMQNITAALENKMLKELFSNCNYKCFLDQGGADANALAQIQELSQTEFNALNSEEVGKGVMVWGKKVVLFDAKISKENELYPLINTNFHEKAKEAEKKKQKQRQEQQESNDRIEEIILQMAELAPVTVRDLLSVLEITQEEAEKQLSFLCQQGYLIKSEEAGNIRYQKAG